LSLGRSDAIVFNILSDDLDLCSFVANDIGPHHQFIYCHLCNDFGNIISCQSLNVAIYDVCFDKYTFPRNSMACCNRLCTSLTFLASAQNIWKICVAYIIQARLSVLQPTPISLASQPMTYETLMTSLTLII
jgi:hypothetical protein